jgi:hypothetical protein
MMPMSQSELEDAIVSLVQKHYRDFLLTHKNISEWIFCSDCHTASVNAACLRLIAQRRLDRDGLGVAYSPYKYRPWREPADRRD